MAGMASRLIAAAAILVFGPVDNVIKQTLSPEARRMRDLKAQNPVQVGHFLHGNQIIEKESAEQYLIITPHACFLTLFAFFCEIS